jgi:cobalamin synthase
MLGAAGIVHCIFRVVLSCAPVRPIERTTILALCFAEAGRRARALVLSCRKAITPASQPATSTPVEDPLVGFFQEVCQRVQHERHFLKA